MINYDICQDAGPVLQNYISYSELTWHQNLSGEQTQKTSWSKIKVTPAVSEMFFKVAKPVQEVLALQCASCSFSGSHNWSWHLAGPIQCLWDSTVNQIRKIFMMKRKKNLQIKAVFIWII